MESIDRLWSTKTAMSVHIVRDFLFHCVSIMGLFRPIWNYRSRSNLRSDRQTYFLVVTMTFRAF